MDWIFNNKEWLFSGAGFLIVAAVAKFIWGKITKSGQLDKPKVPETNIIQGMGQEIESKQDTTFENNEQKITIDKDKSKESLSEQKMGQNIRSGSSVTFKGNHQKINKKK